MTDSERENPEASPATPIFTSAERDWLLLLSFLYLEQGKSADAAVLLRVLYRSFPDDPEVQRCLSLAELFSGQPVEAARVAVRALQRDDDTLRVPVGLVFAKALWEQGAHDAAREYLASLLTPPTPSPTNG